MVRDDHRLKILTQHGVQADAIYSDLNLSDDVTHLNEIRRTGWRRVLSSVATTEGLEQILIEPIKMAYINNPDVLAYLETHHRDEARHRDTLNRYLKSTFDYVKTKRTVTDQVVYDTILPKLSKFFVKNPAYGLALIDFLETYSVPVYNDLRQQAEVDGLSNLVEIFKVMTKDEIRHRTGVRHLLEIRKCEKGPMRRWERAFVRSSVELMVLDLKMSKWAIHNREIRTHLQKISISTEKMDAIARETVQAIMRGL